MKTKQVEMGHDVEEMVGRSSFGQDSACIGDWQRWDITEKIGVDSVKVLDKMECVVETGRNINVLGRW